MIYIDDNDPEGDLDPYFKPRDVTIKYNTNPTDHFDTIDEIGRGKFGTVYKCREKSTGLKLAAKFIPIPKREDRRNVEREVEIMNSLQHHLIIQLYAAYEHQKMMYVIQELVEGGELFDRVIDDEFVLTEKVCTVFVRQICEAMQFIHSKYILHLDLKPENILCLTKEGNRIKIIDFGLARKYDPDKKLQILFGTPEFVAPEVVNFDCISYGTDMWSVGVICYVLLSGLSPFMGETDLSTMANVTIAKYDFDDEAFNNVSSDAMDFISKLLVRELSDRMTATEALEHKWLKRPPKPRVSPKPCIIPPIKFKTTPPPPPTLLTNDIKETLNEKELEQTKDNLKNFIERWEEHPNSPYVFDTENNLIVPIRDNMADSINSSRACSPSPCESILSIPETDVQASREDLTNKTLTPSSTGSINLQRQSSFIEHLNDSDNLSPTIHSADGDLENESINQFNHDFKEYLQSFERRNSDTNYLLGRKSSGERVNLADEIKKLSEHLLMLAEYNTKFSQNDDINEDTKNESADVVPQINVKIPLKNTQKTHKTPNFEKQKSLNTELPKLKTKIERQTSVPVQTSTDQIKSKSGFPLNKSRTNKSIIIPNAVQKSFQAPKKSIKPIARQESILQQSEDDDYSTSSTISIGSTKSKTKSASDTQNQIQKNKFDKSDSIGNDERRLSDTQSAALTISKFVQISKGKEKASQYSFATQYKEQQRQQQENYEQRKQQQQINLINSQRGNTLSTHLHQTIDDLPKLTNGASIFEQRQQQQQQQEQKSFHHKRNSLLNNSSISMNSSTGRTFESTFYDNKTFASSNKSKSTYSTNNTSTNDSINTTLNGYGNRIRSGGGSTTRQVSSIKESIENNKHTNKSIKSITTSYGGSTTGSGTTQRRMSSSIASIYEKFSENNNNTTDSSNNNFDELNSPNQYRIGVPWAMHAQKRTKFRISETSRDVPVGSPNTHQTYNLEEAATQTKDCLLHLLEKYNNTKLRSANTTGRHQSFSVDLGFSQNLENQTMSSINTFFQRNAISGNHVRNIQAQIESKTNHDCGD